MPKFITNDFKGKELYFDLRPEGSKDPEGFWAMPCFESDRKAIQQEMVAKGQGERPVWIEMLKRHITKWQGFKDIMGKDIPCTPESIDELCESDTHVMIGIHSLLVDAANCGQVLAEKN